MKSNFQPTFFSPHLMIFHHFAFPLHSCSFIFHILSPCEGLKSALTICSWTYPFKSTTSCLVIPPDQMDLIGIFDLQHLMLCSVVGLGYKITYVRHHDVAWSRNCCTPWGRKEDKRSPKRMPPGPGSKSDKGHYGIPVDHTSKQALHANALIFSEVKLVTTKSPRNK